MRGRGARAVLRNHDNGGEGIEGSFRQDSWNR